MLRTKKLLSSENVENEWLCIIETNECIIWKLMHVYYECVLKHFPVVPIHPYV